MGVTKAASSISEVLKNNKKWADAMRATRPDYFERLVATQAPEFLWIGCADSRVPANEILGLAPGEVFVQRNVGNLAVPRDMNAMACLEYAVDVLKVKHVIVCGHYGCGAVKGALELPAATGGFVAHWISDIRATRDRHAAALRGLPSQTARWDRLCELNVVHQVFNVTLAPIIQAAWARGQGVAVHGLVYSLADGLLKEVCSPIACGGDMEAAAAQAEAAAVAGDESDAMLGEAFSTHQWFATEAAKDVVEKQAGGGGAKGEAGGACCAGGGAGHAAHAAAAEKAAATAGS